MLLIKKNFSVGCLNVIVKIIIDMEFIKYELKVEDE